MKKIIILPVLASLFAVPALAQSTESDAPPADTRMRVLHYDSNDIYTLMTRVGYQSNIEFATREEVDTISVGDRSFWQIIPSGNRLFIRPLAEGVSTNMTVITNRRSYQFDLKSSADAQESIVYVARFEYPDEKHAPQPYPLTASLSVLPRYPADIPEVSAPPPALPPVAHVPPPPAMHAGFPPTPAGSEIAVPVAGRNYLYTYSGLEAAAPYEVFDDGTSTYFRFSAPPAAPLTVAVPQKEGSEKALTVYRKGEYYVVDAIAQEMRLRSSGETIYVFNETPTNHP